MTSLARLLSPLTATIAALAIVACSSDDPNGPGGVPVAFVSVAPVSMTLTLGQTGTFAAVLQSTGGSILTGRTITWTSSNSSVASVNAGVVTANAPGAATITATSEGVTDASTITVTTTIAQATFSTIAPGGNHTCALDAAGKAYCWGANNVGDLGIGTTGGVYFTPQAATGNLTFATISAGFDHTCALNLAGVAYCWGSNIQGQLGDGTTVDRNAPTPVNTALVFSSIAASGDPGGGHTCALTSGGAAYCWGRNVSGELGNNSTTNQSTPVAVEGGLTFTSLSAGNFFSCGLAAQKGYCWGDNDEIGEGTLFNRPSPTAVAGNLTFKSLVASWGSACGISLADTAYCWGFVASSIATTQPVLESSLTFGSMAPANMFTCGTTLAGAGYCWGVNSSGQLGDGSTAPRPTPVAVFGTVVFAKIVAGNGHACGLTASGLAYCWGVNTSGQVGDGTQDAKLLPTAVRSPQ